MTHSLDSIMLYIHPPLAVIGYVFIIFALIFIITLFIKKSKPHWAKATRVSLILAWLFSLLGLVTGMLWAQSAWGAYWSWDPKENITLAIFILVCFAGIFYETKCKKCTLIMLIFSVVTVLVSIFITLGNYGVHSYGALIF
ncbi:cytochrome c biogenesis protein CcsA [[Eubacterium] cellulosolvens]